MGGQRFSDRQERLDQAQLRASIQIARTPETPVRVRGRRLNYMPAVVQLPVASSSLNTLLADSELRNKVFARAGAVWVAGDIAMVVTPQARAVLVDELGSKLRSYAISNRRFARVPSEPEPFAPDGREQAEKVLVMYEQAKLSAAWVWSNGLPAPLNSELAPLGEIERVSDGAKLGLLACLELAFEAETRRGEDE